MWNGKTIAVIIPARNEQETIREIVGEVFREAPVDEVLVVNNNSTDNTAAEVASTKARLVFEARTGYGHALQRGLKEAEADYLVFFDADGNFPAKDILKLLAYAEEFEFVKGTRARPELTEEGVYAPWLSWLVIVANVWVAKFQQFLFRGPVLTDAGCSLRLLHRRVRDLLLPHVTVGGGHFLVDLTNLAMLAKVSMIEVPVRFTKRRGGVSKHGAFGGLAKIALRMVRHSLMQRFRGCCGYYRFGGS